MSNFTNFMGKVGNGLYSAAKTMAPIAGTALGGMFGGPMGAMVGSQIGGMFGGMGGGSQQPQPQPQGQNQSMGGSYGQQAGNYMNNMLPQQYQGMNMSDLGKSASNYAGNYANNMLPKSMQGMGLGNHLSGFLNNQISSRMPAAYRDQTLSGAGQMAGQQMGQRFGFADGGSVPQYNSMRDMSEGLGHNYGHGGSVEQYYDDGGSVYDSNDNAMYHGAY